MNQNLNNIELVIFDLDGTLVDAYGAIADSINFMLRELGYPPQTLRAVKRSVGWGVDSLVKCFVPAEQAVEALQIFREHHDKRLRQKIRLLPGTKALLPYLKSKGCRLAIASNRPTKFCHIILRALEIDNYFDWVICGDAVKRPKPYPDMLLAIMKEAGVSRSRTIYVGDMSVDVLAARRARVMSVAVPTGSCTRQEILDAKPNHLLERLSQVRTLIA